MKTKNMTKEQALKTIDILNKRIEFNNKLNAFVRKFRKENNIKDANTGANNGVGFNGFWDEPTVEMQDAMNDILYNNKLEDMSWMSDGMRKMYEKNTSAIFGQIYSPAVNSYILKDLHDCEKYVKTFDSASENEEEENELFKVERDTTSNRINLYFDGIPDESVRTVIKHNGFRWSPNYKCWTRQLTDEAEVSLRRIKKDLNLI